MADVASAREAPSTRLDSSCPNCRFLAWCSPAGLAAPDAQRLHNAVVHRRSIARGGFLCRAGETLGSLYVVRSGILKATLTHENGGVQVTGFLMTGDVAGIDAIASSVHQCDLIALEDSSVCGIRYAEFMNISRSAPELQHHFHRLLSAEIARTHELMFLLGSMTARQRVAMFILMQSKRSPVRGSDGSRFTLPMSRQDISSFLGLKLETVCRSITGLQRSKVIAIKRRDVVIEDPAGLEALIRLKGAEKSAARRARDRP